METIELIYDYPAEIARKLQEGEIDMGLVPVTILPQLPENYIYTDYCIGCNGAVASVCLFSEVPLEKVERVLLDYQSRTSVALARILISEHWKIEAKLIDTKSDFRGDIRGTTAAVVIGDRALQQRKISPYIYDLGEAWKNFTGLPFVFANWIANKKLPDGFIAAFDAANKSGLLHIDKVVAETPYDVFDLKEYYTKYVDYNYDYGKMQGKEIFLRLVKDCKAYVPPVRKS